MGYPRKIHRAEIRPGCKHRLAHDPHKLAYGTHMKCHYKAVPDLYHHGLKSHTDWLDVRKRMGCEVIVEDVPYINQYCYTR